jgi:hypothetical protein
MKAKLWAYNADQKEAPVEQTEDFLNDFNFTTLDKVFNKPEGDPVLVPLGANPKLNVDEFMEAFNKQLTDEIDPIDDDEVEEPIDETPLETIPAPEKVPSRITQNKEAINIEVDTRDVFGEWG